MTDKEMPILDKLGVDIGYQTSYSKTITERDIELFAEVSGDYNPVHMDEEFAKKTFFGGRIAHGVLSLALVSAVGAKLPGLVILLSMSSKFSRPVKIGDTITATAEVVKAHKERGIVTLKTACTNQKGEVLVDGETMVRLFERPA